MLKTVSLKFQKTDVDFLFYRDDNQSQINNSLRYHKHLNYEIHFALQGSYNYELNGENILLAENQMLIIPPEMLHKSVNPSEDKYKFAVLTLKISSNCNDDFEKFLNSIFLRHASKCLNAEKEIIEAVLKFIGGIEKKSQLQDIYLVSCASEAFYKLCDFLVESEEDFPFETEKHLDVKIENMVNNVNLSLADIAMKINYSPRQTERLIKKIYGKSLTEVRADFK